MKLTASDAALDYGIAAAEELMNRREGQTGAPIGFRQLTGAQLAALLAIAFDAGRAEQDKVREHVRNVINAAVQR